MFESKKINRTMLIVLAAFLVVVGILFCLSNSIGTKAANIVLSIAIILGGLFPVIRSLADKNRLVTPGALLGGAVIALGVFSIVYNVATLILLILPFVMIVVGVFSLTEAFMMMFVRGDRNKPLFIAEVIIGIIMVTLGILIFSVEGVSKASGIIFGIMILFAGVYTLIMVLVVKNDDDFD